MWKLKRTLSYTNSAEVYPGRTTILKQLMVKGRFCSHFVFKPKAKEKKWKSALITSSLIQEGGFLSQVHNFSCNISLLSKYEKHSTFYLSANLSSVNSLPLRHKPHSRRAPAIWGSLPFIKDYMQFHTHMPLLGTPFSSTLFWLLFTDQTKAQAAPCGAFPGKNPSSVPPQYFCLGLSSPWTASLSTLSTARELPAGKTPIHLAEQIPNTALGKQQTFNLFMVLCWGIICKK